MDREATDYTDYTIEHSGSHSQIETLKNWVLSNITFLTLTLLHPDTQIHKPTVTNSCLQIPKLGSRLSTVKKIDAFINSTMICASKR